MKKSYVKLFFAIVMLFFVNIHLFATIYNINRESGTVSVWGSAYVRNVNHTWNINAGVNKVMELICTRDIEYGSNLKIYEIDGNGREILLREFTNNGPVTTIKTTIPNGKAKIVFSSGDDMLGWGNGYNGFKIDFSVDNNSSLIPDDLIVKGKSYLYDDLTLYNNLVVGTPDGEPKKVTINGHIDTSLKILFSNRNIEVSASSPNQADIRTTLSKFVFNKAIYLNTGEIGTSGTRDNLKLLTNSTDRLTILGSNGYVGVGTTNPLYLLDVKGTMRAQEVKIEVTNWPDYVFEEDYELPSLNEVEAHIREHKHLPGIPPAKEAEEEGVSVGEINKKLLQKIEELTLYMIQQEQRMKVMQLRMDELEKQNKIK